MPQHLALVSVVVHDYDEAIAFYVDKLGFILEADLPLPEQHKRWVVVRPPGAAPQTAGILLARASHPQQAARVGDQTGGRVFLFLHSDDLQRDCATYKSRGVVFVREPRVEAYGTVAVFKDLYGNLWDLVQPGSRHAA
jgi:catechol 2,3-dioxygenase-like lactoylglutathione lyase family enzyme